MKTLCLILCIVVATSLSVASETMKADLVLMEGAHDRVLLPRSWESIAYVQPCWIIFEARDKNGNIVPPKKIPQVKRRIAGSWRSEMESVINTPDNCGAYIPVAGYKLGENGFPSTFEEIEERTKSANYKYTLRLQTPITIHYTNIDYEVEKTVMVKSIYRFKSNLYVPSDTDESVQNKQVNPIVTTPVGEVEAQGTQDHHP